MNKKGNTALIVILIIVVLLILAVVGGYNSLVQKDVSVEKAWGNVETAYQRQADLIPNLVEVVKGVSNFEKSTYVAVTEARTQWLNAGTSDEKIATSAGFDSAVARLLVSVEAYPELKANQNYLALQDELSGTQNRIKFERDNYNEAVKNYEQAVRMFPGNIIANMFGFSVDKWKMFASTPGAETVPKVNLTI